MRGGLLPVIFCARGYCAASGFSFLCAMCAVQCSVCQTLSANEPLHPTITETLAASRFVHMDIRLIKPDRIPTRTL